MHFGNSSLDEDCRLLGEDRLLDEDCKAVEWRASLMASRSSISRGGKHVRLHLGIESVKGIERMRATVAFLRFVRVENDVLLGINDVRLLTREHA